MKKIFLKRHSLFFVILTILIACQALVIKAAIQAYKRKIIQKESIAALERTLEAKTTNLPQDHLSKERQKRHDIVEYRNFVCNTWPKMANLAYATNSRAVPPNYVALFFALSDYITWAKECCDAFEIEFEPDCSFGLQDLLERNDETLTGEIGDIHIQKEHIKLLLSYLIESKLSYLKISSIKRSGTTQSAYFTNRSIFTPEVNHITDSRAFLYKIKFSTFTATFRNFLKMLYDNEIPIIFREISVSSDYAPKMSKNSSEEILECAPSSFSLTIEFLNIPHVLAKKDPQNAAILRKILYETSQ